MDSASVTSALQAACPSVVGVAGPVVPPAPWPTFPAGDGTRWRIDFDASATDAGRQAAVSALAAYTVPALAPTVTGNQWAFALNTLSLAPGWMAGVARSKPSDQFRVGLIGRDTPLVAADPLLLRVAANAGTDASGAPLISVPAVFAVAQGMPL